MTVYLPQFAPNGLVSLGALLEQHPVQSLITAYPTLSRTSAGKHCMKCHREPDRSQTELK